MLVDEAQKGLDGGGKRARIRRIGVGRRHRVRRPVRFFAFTVRSISKLEVVIDAAVGEQDLGVLPSVLRTAEKKEIGFGRPLCGVYPRLNGLAASGSEPAREGSRCSAARLRKDDKWNVFRNQSRGFSFSSWCEDVCACVCMPVKGEAARARVVGLTFHDPSSEIGAGGSAGTFNRPSCDALAGMPGELCVWLI